MRAECIKQIKAFRTQIQRHGSVLKSQLCLIGVWALQCIVLNANDHGEGEQISHYAICFLDTYSLSLKPSMSIAVLGFLNTSPIAGLKVFSLQKCQSEFSEQSQERSYDENKSNRPDAQVAHLPSTRCCAGTPRSIPSALWRRLIGRCAATAPANDGS